MLVWLITVGEPLPLKNSDNRLLRTGILAKLLIELGHEVVWWSSTLNHQNKNLIAKKSSLINVSSTFKIWLLHGLPYKRNISIRRLINHYGIARQFEIHSKFEIKPDIILCSFPTIELSVSALNYGHVNNVPVILDIRDLWPDHFLSLIPKRLSWIGRIILSKYFKNTKAVFQKCTSIVAVSEEYLKWGLSYAGRSRRETDAVFPIGYQKLEKARFHDETIINSLKNMGVDPSKKICWFIGAFGKTYDLGTIINAAVRLNDREKEQIQFVFSGNGENYSLWSQQARGIKNIIFTKWVDTSQISYLMDISYLGLAAYAKGAPQGLPNKLFEYMSAGLPILSCLEGEAADLIRENYCGLSYKAGDDLAFLDGLRFLVKNQETRNQMAANAARLFEEKFSAEKIYVQMEKFLENIALGKDKVHLNIGQ